MLKTILFDVNGVVSSVDFTLVDANFAHRVGLEMTSFIRYRKESLDDLMVGKINIDQFFSNIPGENNPRNESADYRAMYLEEGLKVVKVNTDLLRSIDHLRKQYSIGILSNVTPLRKVIDEAIGLYEHFDHTTLSCKEGTKKPDPRFFALALRRASAQPFETVFIDDREKYITAARALGVKGIVYRDNETLMKELGEFLNA